MRWIRVAALGMALLSMVTAAPDEKRISIYSPVANYSLNIAERDGKDYVGLLEILEPLSSVSAKPEGQKWKLKFNGIEGQFSNGNSKARIRGRDFELGSRFVLESGRGLVPVDSLVTLLPQFLGIPVVFHVNSRRLFISENGTTYSAEMSKTAPGKLVLNFSKPVNPTIGTEPGKLRMVFVRDPLLPSGAETANYNDKAITSSTYQEANGAAELTVSGSVPLMASFSNDGRTITIAAVAASPGAPASARSSSSAQPPATSPQAPPTAASGMVMPTPRIFAVIDASHGGSESGAAFSATLVEKDVTLGLARQLRQELINQGITTMLLRDSDSFLALDQRAANTNSVRPAIYIALHAAREGSGVRVYTGQIPSAGESRGPFVSWNSAQSAALTLSQMAASSVAAELGKKVAARILTAPLRPLNNITAPALAIEIASPSGDVAELTSPDYQQMVSKAVATGIASVHSKLEAR